jgi:hypothetical protein
MASAIVKDVGRMLLSSGVSEFAMPFATGLVFAIPLAISLCLLNSLPPPTLADEQERTRREPMRRADRWTTFARFAFGLVCLVLVYVMLTAYRDFRDTFMADILQENRRGEPAASFTSIETQVALFVLLALLPLVFVRKNITAFVINHGIILIGCVTAGVATLLFQTNQINDVSWMVATGIGTYLAYVPFNCILFDRMIAAFRQVSNVGFFIYIADAFGYLGTVLVMLYKDFGAKDPGWVPFFQSISYLLAMAGGALTLISLIYFVNKHRNEVSMSPELSRSTL